MIVVARVHSGTANFAAFLAVDDAIDFHSAIGVAGWARLVCGISASLWVEPLRDKLRILTPDDDLSSRGHHIVSHSWACFRGRERRVIAKMLLDKHRIFTVHRTGVAAGVRSCDTGVVQLGR